MATESWQRVNANEVLPPNLVAQIQRHVAAAYLWIPSLGRQAARRRVERVVRFSADGMAPCEIAARVGITERRVYQILQAQRQGVPS